MKLIISLLVITFCLTGHAYEDKKCLPVRVIDGDTIVCNIPGWPEIIGREISVRLKDCDSPEIRTSSKAEKELGLRARQELIGEISGAEVLILRNIERGKYFRLTADVYLHNSKLNCPFSKMAHAKPTYQCGTKTKCSQMSSCEEAYFFLHTCKLTKLDRDKDGIPCESLCN